MRTRQRFPLALASLCVLLGLPADPRQAPAQTAGAATAAGEEATIPGGRAEDTAAAINTPHEFAWSLFLALNRQALPGSAGKLDPTRETIRQYDPDRPVVWETWALASGGRAGPIYIPPNRSEVFKDKAVKPVTWDQLDRSTPQPKVFEKYPGKGLDFLLHVGRAAGKFDPVEDGEDGGVEVRMNRNTFDYVLDNDLYSIEGLEERLRSGEPLKFPQASKEVKARWVRINERDKPRYHWRTVKGKDGETQIWGLTAMHIITRDLPNWFWCDFEHGDFERHAEQYSQDSTTRGENPPSGRRGVRNETKGTKWEQMRLRGAQVNFVDAEGNHTILANTQIEHGFQQKSSCISCHARATVGLRSRRPDRPQWQVNTLPLNLAVHPILDEPTGAPQPNWYVDEDGERIYMQTHFLWSIPFRAMSRMKAPPVGRSSP